MITPAPLAVTGASAANKVYDATTADTLTGGSISALGFDLVTLNTSGAAGTFATKNVGNGIAVSASGYTISGTDAGNYTLVEPTGLAANIAPASLLITGVAANNKVYDATTADMLSGGSITAMGSDSVTLNTSGAAGMFATKNVGTGIGVTAGGYTISGTDAGNYTLVEPVGLSANISSRPLTLTGSSGVNKVADGTTLLPAGTNGYAALSGVLGSDQVGLVGVAQYDSAAAGLRGVVEGTIALSGADADDYSLNWVNGSGTISALSVPPTPPTKGFFPTQPILPEPIIGSVVLAGSQGSLTPVLWHDANVLGDTGIADFLAGEHCEDTAVGYSVPAHMLRESVGREAGRVGVQVAERLPTGVCSFSIRLPQEMFDAGTPDARVSVEAVPNAQSTQPPGRLHYDASRRALIVTPIGAEATAFQVAISVGANRYILMISTTR